MIFGGVKYKRVRHAVYCKGCKDTIESKFQHDFKMCSCGKVGIDFDRVLGKDLEDRSVYCADISGRKFWMPA